MWYKNWVQLGGLRSSWLQVRRSGTHHFRVTPKTEAPWSSICFPHPLDEQARLQGPWRGQSHKLGAWIPALLLREELPQQKRPYWTLAGVRNTFYCFMPFKFGIVACWPMLNKYKMLLVLLLSEFFYFSSFSFFSYQTKPLIPPRFCSHPPAQQLCASMLSSRWKSPKFLSPPSLLF